MLVHLGDRYVLHDRQATRHETLLDLRDDVGHVPDDLVALHRNRDGFVAPRTRTRACCALISALTQMSAKASEATSARTSRSINHGGFGSPGR